VNHTKGHHSCSLAELDSATISAVVPSMVDKASQKRSHEPLCRMITLMRLCWGRTSLRQFFSRTMYTIDSCPYVFFRASPNSFIPALPIFLGPQTFDRHQHGVLVWMQEVCKTIPICASMFRVRCRVRGDSMPS